MTEPTSARRLELPPDVTEEEAAAIVAALDAATPSAVGGAPEGEPPRWRFSGRWWTKPIADRRDRP